VAAREYIKLEYAAENSTHVTGCFRKVQWQQLEHTKRHQITCVCFLPGKEKARERDGQPQRALCGREKRNVYVDAKKEEGRRGGTCNRFFSELVIKGVEVSLLPENVSKIKVSQFRYVSKLPSVLILLASNKSQ
jgi:hypothetical protein